MWEFSISMGISLRMLWLELWVIVRSTSQFLWEFRWGFLISMGISMGIYMGIFHFYGNFNGDVIVVIWIRDASRILTSQFLWEFLWEFLIFMGILIGILKWEFSISLGMLWSGLGVLAGSSLLLNGNVGAALVVKVPACNFPSTTDQIKFQYWREKGFWIYTWEAQQRNFLHHIAAKSEEVVNIFQKLCFEWWMEGGGRKPVRGLNEVKAFFPESFQSQIGTWAFLRAPELQMTRRRGGAGEG